MTTRNKITGHKFMKNNDFDFNFMEQLHPAKSSRYKPSQTSYERKQELGSTSRKSPTMKSSSVLKKSEVKVKKQMPHLVHNNVISRVTDLAHCYNL